MEQKKTKYLSIIHIYIIVLLTLYNICLVDVKIAGMPIKILLLLFSTLITLFFSVLTRQIHNFRKEAISKLDIMLISYMILTLCCLFYKLFIQGWGYESEAIIVSLIMCYLILAHAEEQMTEQICFMFSVSNGFIYLICLYQNIVDINFTWPIQTLINLGYTAWLAISLLMNILLYCCRRRNEYWYLGNSILGAFLLFLDHNVLAIAFIGIVILTIPVIFAPRMRLVKRTMQIFFTYSLLLCNMSLIVNYTSLIRKDITYDLELGVYLELLLAIVALVLMNAWDQELQKDEEADILYKMKNSFQQLIVITIVIVSLLGIDTIRGKSVLMPELIGKIIELIRNSVGKESNLLQQITERYGSLGFVLMAVFYIALFRKMIEIYQDDRDDIRIVFAMSIYVMMQSLFLTQSINSLTTCVLFISLMFREYRKDNILTEETIQAKQEIIEQNSEEQQVDFQNIEQENNNNTSGEKTSRSNN